MNISISTLLKVVSLCFSHFICELVLKMINRLFPFWWTYIVVFHHKLIFRFDLFCRLFWWRETNIHKFTLVCDSFESWWFLASLSTARVLICCRSCISRWYSLLNRRNFIRPLWSLRLCISRLSAKSDSFRKLFLTSYRLAMSASNIQQPVFSNSSQWSCTHSHSSLSHMKALSVRPRVSIEVECKTSKSSIVIFIIFIIKNKSKEQCVKSLTHNLHRALEWNLRFLFHYVCSVRWGRYFHL